MFSHVMLGANDIEESKEFYDQILAVLGARPVSYTHLTLPTILRV